MADLELVVVILDPGPELHLFDLDRVLFLPRLAGGPRRLVLVLPVVHHLDHGGAGLRRHFDQIHPSVRRPLAGLVDGDDADLLAIVLDEPHGADPDLLVDADSLFADCLYTSFGGWNKKGPRCSRAAIGTATRGEAGCRFLRPSRRLEALKVGPSGGGPLLSMSAPHRI